MKTKKRKLKRWVKITMFILLSIMFISLFIKVINKQLEKCDKKKGYNCTLYDLKGGTK